MPVHFNNVASICNDCIVRETEKEQCLQLKRQKYEQSQLSSSSAINRTLAAVPRDKDDVGNVHVYLK